ncbi:hypothetical protein TALC_00117 [Thermoplasmatales archaeon BRNA1]|nr:hypothetical protein TALC_00117 [Thermoplasmatales archaeon BRNA1]
MKYAKIYNDKYYHWDELKYKDFGDSSRDDVWKIMKIFRILSYRSVNIGNKTLYYSVADDYIQRALHEIDSRIASGFLISGDVTEKRRIMLSVSSMMEESIASSQLEGASTTTKLAKKLLRSNLEPKDRSQRMILNNYHAMQFIKERLDEPLSLELIKDVHRVITESLMDDPQTSGEFRTDDSIAVRDVYEDVTYHVPVSHTEIGKMIVDLCDYVNEDAEFIHPLIKGIMIHFILAYIHPFLDGNGRVSRALFYWYCMKNGYSMVEFLSISKTIKNHRQDYDRSYLLTETDGMDATYFARYNLKMVSEAIDVFDTYLKRKMDEQKKLIEDLHMTGLSYRQSQILKDMVRSGEPVSQYELSVKYQTTVPTIRRDLIALLESGYISLAGKDGHRQLYIYSKEKN